MLDSSLSSVCSCSQQLSDLRVCVGVCLSVCSVKEVCVCVCWSIIESMNKASFLQNDLSQAVLESGVWWGVKTFQNYCYFIELTAESEGRCAGGHRILVI